MPVQREHLEEANVKRRETFQKQYLLSSFSLLAKFLSGAKRRAACCCRRGERVYRKKINTKKKRQCEVHRQIEQILPVNQEWEPGMGHGVQKEGEERQDEKK